MGGVYCEDCDIARALPGDDSKELRGVRPRATDPVAAGRLWQLSEQLTGVANVALETIMGILLPTTSRRRESPLQPEVGLSVPEDDRCAQTSSVEPTDRTLSSTPAGNFATGLACKSSSTLRTAP